MIYVILKCLDTICHVNLFIMDYFKWYDGFPSCRLHRLWFQFLNSVATTHHWTMTARWSCLSWIRLAYKSKRCVINSEAWTLAWSTFCPSVQFGNNSDGFITTTCGAWALLTFGCRNKSSKISFCSCHLGNALANWICVSVGFGFPAAADVFFEAISHSDNFHWD